MTKKPLKRGVNRGRANGRAKLTNRQVLAIFNSDRRQVDLARKYKVSQSMVNKIQTGRAWAWLTKVR